MKICDWLFPWRAKRYLEESDKLHSHLLNNLQSLTDQLTNLQIERQKLVDTYDKLQESYHDQISNITTMFHVEQSKLNEALTIAHENNKRVLGEKFGLLDKEREDLTKRAVSAEDALQVSQEETRSEQRKIRALERWIKNVHRLDNESTEGTIKRIMQQSAMATRLFFFIGMILLTSCATAQQPPILRNFFTTNQTPSISGTQVDYTAGANVIFTTNNHQVTIEAVIAGGGASRQDATNAAVGVLNSNIWNFQHGTATLTNWSALPTNTFDWLYQHGSALLSNAQWTFQNGSLNLSNWSLLPTNVFDWKYQSGTANGSNWALLPTNVFDWKYQAGSLNLSNWSQLPTNTFLANQYTTNFFRGFVVEALGVSKGDILCAQGAGFGVNNGDTFVALAKNNDLNLLPVIGVAGEDAAFNTYVTVVVVGDVWFDTSAFLDGDNAYLGNNGKISTCPTDPNAVIIKVGMVAFGNVAGILRVRIQPRFDSYSVFENAPGNLENVLWNPLNNGFAGSYFVARNFGSKAMYGINDANASPNFDSQIINNSGIPILFQIASNTAATISTASNLSVGWFGKFSGNGSGLSNDNGSGFVAIKSGYATNLNATNLTLSGPIIMYGDNARSNGVAIGNYGEVLSNANGKVQISGGNITNSGYVISTNGLYMVCVTNNVAPPPNVLQPIGLFGSMMLSNVTNTITVGSSGVYRTLTNYQVLRTNGFIAVPGWNGGYLTNTIAGYYKIFYYVSMLPGNSDMIETEVFVNGIAREEISGFGQFDTPARVRTISGGGILYLPAMSYVSLNFNNRSSANNIAVWRAGFTIGTP